MVLGTSRNAPMTQRSIAGVRFGMVPQSSHCFEFERLFSAFDLRCDSEFIVSPQAAWVGARCSQGSFIAQPSARKLSQMHFTIIPVRCNAPKESLDSNKNVNHFIRTTMTSGFSQRVILTVKWPTIHTQLLPIINCDLFASDSRYMDRLSMIMIK